MDTFAAFALATEPPIDSVLKGPPFKEDTHVLTTTMWRQILGITFWNVIVMLLVILIGPHLAGYEYKFTTSPNDSNKEGQAKLKHMTIIFTTFVFLQLFNEINCRKIDRRDFNVFENILANPYFHLVVDACFGV